MMRRMMNTDPLPVGNYKVRFTLYDNNGSRNWYNSKTTFTVKALDFMSLP